MKHTPLLIKVILHYHCQEVDFNDSPAFRNVALYLEQNDILRKTGKEKPKWEINRKSSEVYINALEKIPLPVKEYVIPDSKPLSFVNEVTVIPNVTKEQLLRY